MGKVLIIKGANFSENALTKVTVNDIPCTDISFSESAYLITGYDATSISYTVTPENTTDEVILTSSDNSVITVVNGVLTPIGIGSATITAACGERSDSATITVAFSYVSGIDFGYVSYNSSTGIISYAYMKSHLTFFGKDNQATQYSIVCTSQETAPNGNKAIKLPQNTTKVRINITNKTPIKNGNYSGNVTWLKDESAGNSTYPNNIKYINTDFFNLKTASELEFGVPEGADSMIFDAQLADAAPEGTDPTTYANGIGLGIEFLAE